MLQNIFKKNIIMRKSKDKTQELILTELISTVEELRKDIQKSKQQTESIRSIRKTKKK